MRWLQVSLLITGLLVLVAGCRGVTPAGDGVPVGESPPAEPWLVDVTDVRGLTFRHRGGATEPWASPEIMGGGVALNDFDDDGDLDVYFVNGGAAVGASPSPDIVNRLFLQGEDGRFVDATTASGLGDAGYGMGVAVGDIDNDGDADVYVTNLGRDRLYLNRGLGVFDDVTETAGIDVVGWSASAVFLDYDLDGFLDLYVTRYVVYEPGKRCFDRAGRPDYCGPTAYSPVPDVLLRSLGDGRFEDVSEATGIATLAAAGLGVVTTDVNDDGWPDIYVANDAYPNNLWMSQGDGTFRDEAMLQGVAYNLNGQAEAGMGVLLEDLDLDGHDDFFVTHLMLESNTLYRGRGAGLGFVDGTGGSGLGLSSMSTTGFGVVALDLELDGDLDLAVANGRVNRGQPVPGADVGPPWDRLAEQNLFYLNSGHGRFVSEADMTRPFTGHRDVSRGLASGDIDGDGDLDLVVSNIEGPARLYHNEAPRRGHWLSVRAVDPRVRRDAIGARVVIEAGGRRWSRQVSSAGSYLTSQEAVAHFGLGEVEALDALEVRWPDGAVERFSPPPLDSAVVLQRGTGLSGKIREGGLP